MQIDAIGQHARPSSVRVRLTVD
jgi:signal transduction histidine kinase